MDMEAKFTRPCLMETETQFKKLSQIKQIEIKRIKIKIER
jgi:hypothetical protein